jgi:hypothetical protein
MLVKVLICCHHPWPHLTIVSIYLLYGLQEIHVSQSLSDALTILQHRGQDAAGIVTSHGGRLNMRKDVGSVADVFTQDNIVNLRGSVGIGHVRYPTAGGSCSAEAQVFSSADCMRFHRFVGLSASDSGFLIAFSLFTRIPHLESRLRITEI